MPGRNTACCCKSPSCSTTCTARATCRPNSPEMYEAHSRRCTARCATSLHVRWNHCATISSIPIPDPIPDRSGSGSPIRISPYCSIEQPDGRAVPESQPPTIQPPRTSNATSCPPLPHPITRYPTPDTRHCSEMIPRRWRRMTAICAAGNRGYIPRFTSILVFGEQHARLAT